MVAKTENWTYVDSLGSKRQIWYQLLRSNELAEVISHVMLV